MLGFKQEEAIRPVTTAPAPVPGLAEAMAAQGWQPVEERLFGGHLEDQVHTATRSLYGATHPSNGVAAKAGAPRTLFGDGFSGVVNGRTVVVANSWTPTQGTNGTGGQELLGVAVCVAELPARLSIRSVQPRRLSAVSAMPAVPTGNPAFDEHFVVTMAPGPAQPVLVPEVQQRILAHDDWIFVAERVRLVCVSRGPFTTPEEVGTRINELVALVKAIPNPAAPASVDASVEALLARNPGINTLPEALDFLQRLSPEDRQTLARSNTPLAVMADVQTPKEALDRYKGLDQSQKMEIMVMFKQAKEHV